MLPMSIVACAAVAVEGFTPPSKDRLWPIDHGSPVDIAAHDPRMDTKVCGAMKMMEVGLAAAAPHDVVMLDGPVTPQVIHMNGAVEAAYESDTPNAAMRMLVGRYEEFLGRFAEALEGGGPEGKVWASLPKFTTRSKIGRRYREEGLGGWTEDHDDKSVMTAVLGAGERTEPVPITTDDDKWHLPEPRRGGEEGDAAGMVDRVIRAMDDQHVFYYKPREFAPALRVEVAGEVARDEGRMEALLSSLRHQYASYAIMEPYPLYVADKMVKSLGRALPVVRHSAMQRAGDAGSPAPCHPATRRPLHLLHPVPGRSRHGAICPVQIAAACPPCGHLSVILPIFHHIMNYMEVYAYKRPFVGQKLYHRDGSLVKRNRLQPSF